MVAKCSGDVSTFELLNVSFKHSVFIMNIFKLLTLLTVVEYFLNTVQNVPVFEYSQVWLPCQPKSESSQQSRKNRHKTR